MCPCAGLPDHGPGPKDKPGDAKEAEVKLIAGVLVPSPYHGFRGAYVYSENGRRIRRVDGVEVKAAAHRAGLEGVRLTRTMTSFTGRRLAEAHVELEVIFPGIRSTGRASTMLDAMGPGGGGRPAERWGGKWLRSAEWQFKR